MSATAPVRRAGRHRLRAALKLTRPANVVTALADVLAGFAAASAFGAGAGEALPALPWRGGATAGLYAGGVVLNDVFDAELDAVERPERPIPSGRISRPAAAALGGGLLLGGIAAAAVASLASGVVAAAIAAMAVLYDAAGKHHAVLGPLNMGACRGGNLLLGVSAVPVALAGLWALALLPVVYIAAVTVVSRGEVHGAPRGPGVLALGLVGLVLAALLGLGLLGGYDVLEALPFAAVFAGLVGPPFVRAARTPRPETARAAVRAGVLALVALDATLAAGFGGWALGLGVLLLLPLSFGLAQLFAVT
ncbi:MAG: UbiA-like protein EboC [Rhodothermales bacterium]|nr:UbiA-like protein EboC [Rhodothermales bacterium]